MGENGVVERGVVMVSLSVLARLSISLSALPSWSSLPYQLVPHSDKDLRYVKRILNL